MASKKASEQRMVADYRRRTYTTSGGVVLQLRPISALSIDAIRNDMTNRPEPPTIEIAMGEGLTRPALNPDDPDYKRALTEWQNDKNMRGMEYIWTSGIETQPDDETLNRLVKFFPHADPIDLQFMWLCELMPSQAEVNMITEVILSQTMTTETGIAESEAIFPGDGQRSADSALSVPAEADQDNA